MPTCPNCSHDFEVTLTSSRFRPRYEDFVKLADDVLEYTRSSKDTVFSSDDPRTREIGFASATDETKSWRIGLTWVKSVTNLDASPRMQIYKTYLLTATGRIKLAALWSQGVDATEPLPS